MSWWNRSIYLGGKISVNPDDEFDKTSRCGSSWARCGNTHPVPNISNWSHFFPTFFFQWGKANVGNTFLEPEIKFSNSHFWELRQYVEISHRIEWHCTIQVVHCALSIWLCRTKAKLRRIFGWGGTKAVFHTENEFEGCDRPRWVAFLIDFALFVQWHWI